MALYLTHLRSYRFTFVKCACRGIAWRNANAACHRRHCDGISMGAWACATAPVNHTYQQSARGDIGRAAVYNDYKHKETWRS